MLSYGFIQAGGRSSRMGTDKAWVEIEGRTMIERALAAAEPVVDRLGIVIDPSNPRIDRYEQLAVTWSAELIPDLHDHRGPLGGIHTALHHCREQSMEGEPSSSILILACDLPCITAEFLLSLEQIHNNEANDLTLPADQSGRVQPLVAIYSTACLLAVEQMLARDILRIDRLFPLVKSRRVLFQEFAQLPDAEKLLVNVNTREDLRNAIGG